MTRLLRRSGVRHLRDDRGVSLTELVVVMSILPVVLGMGSVALIQALHLQTKTAMRSEAQVSNRVGLEFMTRLLRQATYPQNTPASSGPIITTAEDNKLIFTSHTGNGSTVKRFVFELAGGSTNLNWGVASPSCVGTNPCTYATPTANSTIVAGVRNATSSACPGGIPSSPVFHYYALDATGAPGQLLTTPVAASGTYNLSSIVVVQIDLWTKSRIGGDAPNSCEHITGSVDLRNLQ